MGPGESRPLTAQMEQRVSIITLGVDDLTRSRAFYEALGWRGQEVQETVFFQAGGLAVVLWGRDKLAEDAGVGIDAVRGTALAQNVRSPEEVDAVLAAVPVAGGTVTRPARTTFYGGYAGHFADPDGHIWEIAHNPGFILREDGTLELPDFAAR